MGSGKTTIGKLISEKTQYRFIDTDLLIETEERLTCLQIIETKGQQCFRQKETELLQRLSRQDLHNTIIATGGGMPCFNNNIDTLNHIGTTLYLRWTAQDLTTRLLLTDLNTRPLLKHLSKQQLQQQIEQQINQRERFYRQAHHTIHAPLNTLSENNDNEIADYIIKQYIHDYQRNTKSDNRRI